MIHISVKVVVVESCHAGGGAADLEDPLAELHMEDYDTDEGGEEMDTETASRLFGSGNPGRWQKKKNISVVLAFVVHELRNVGCRFEHPFDSPRSIFIMM